MLDALLDRAAAEIRRSNQLVALTGAGVSTPSGIPDFRSPESGLWTRHDPMSVASLKAFERDPAAFYDWIRPLAQAIFAAAPNPAHYALATLEKLGKLRSIITQNIDRLHSRAGSMTVHEVHGRADQLICTACQRLCDTQPRLDSLFSQEQTVIPNCPGCGSILKPNVVLFGEQLPAQVYLAAHRDARECDVMLVAGSSLEVYPVADLPGLALANGARLILIDKESTVFSNRAHINIVGDVSEIIPAIVDRLEANSI